MASTELTLEELAPDEGARTPQVAGFSRLLDHLAAGFQGALGGAFVFLPVAMGLGTSVYFFALNDEPAPWVLVSLALLAASLMGFAWAWGGALRLPAIGLAMALLGVSAAGYRTISVAAPVLPGRYFGPVEGRVIALDRSSRDVLRITLDRVRLSGFEPGETPERVRLSLHGGAGEDEVPLEPGTIVATTGHLGPPGGPVEPGGFSFRRMAWFLRLGAVGYTRNPVLAMEAPADGWALAIERFRLGLSRGLRARLQGESGGFVAAILTGDRSGVGQDTTEALRRSNLAHLLAISGLHMGLLTAVVFASVRAFLALFPFLVLRYPIRKFAAIAALCAASFYLLLSGGNVATQRAFVMAAVMLGAVLVNRRAVSMRSVALAALLLLFWRPEAIFSAGFQMSFAATVSLVAVFRALRTWREGRPQGPSRRDWRTRLWRNIGSVILCSVVAGLATAPFAAFHFHRYAVYGLVANVLAVPIMGVLVMPAAVLSALLYPVGAERIGLWLMEFGARWVLHVAHQIAGREDAVRMIVSPVDWVMPCLVLSGLFLALWPTRLRLAGAFGIALALAGWVWASPRPDLLVASDGALVGALGSEGRVLSKPRGAGFVATNWLEADGDSADQVSAASRRGAEQVAGGRAFDVAGQRWVHLFGAQGARHLPETCLRGIAVVIDRMPEGAEWPCDLYDPARLARTGALAIRGDRLISAHDLEGRRPWSARGQDDETAR